MASAQQGRNRMLFKAGKVSIIADTLPAFCILCWIYWDFSTLFADFRYLGREIRPAATGISTFSADFRCLGRDLRPVALGISTLFDRFQYSLATETYSCSLKLILPYFTISYSKIGILLIAHVMEIRINYP